MDILLTERQALLRKEIDAFLQPPARERTADVRTIELRNAFWGPERSLLDRALALEELSRLDPGLVWELIGDEDGDVPRRSVYRSAVSLGTAARLLENQYQSLENLGGEVPSSAAGGPGLARGSFSAVLAPGYKPRASGEPKVFSLTDPVRRAAQETVDLVTALETARFLAFRAASLAGTAAAEAGVEAAKCEKLAVEIAERAAASERDGRLRQGDRP